MFREICWVKPKLGSWTHTVYIEYVETHWVTEKFSSPKRIPCLSLGWKHCVRVVAGLRIRCSWSHVNTTVDWVPCHAEFLSVCWALCQGYIFTRPWGGMSSISIDFFPSIMRLRQRPLSHSYPVVGEMCLWGGFGLSWTFSHLSAVSVHEMNVPSLCTHDYPVLISLFALRLSKLPDAEWTRLSVLVRAAAFLLFGFCHVWHYNGGFVPELVCECRGCTIH